MADANTPTQALPHSRIVVNGIPVDPSAGATIAVDGGYEITQSGDGREAFVHYLSGGPATLTVTEGATSGTDDLDSPAPSLTVTLDAPEA